jgi:hypothetical protein
MGASRISGPLTSDSGFVAGTGKTDFSKIVGLESILNTSAGTWTRTRIAAGNYAYRKTAADETAIVGIDITPAIRAATDKGFELASIDVVYGVTTAALDAHSAVLSKVVYANNTAVAVTTVTTSGTLATGTQANPYSSTITVTTPEFLNTANAKYVLEITVNAAATSVYDYYHLNLNFTRNDL